MCTEKNMSEKERSSHDIRGITHELVDCIVKAAEKRGGIYNIAPCGNTGSFRNSVRDGIMYYNFNMPIENGIPKEHNLDGTSCIKLTP